MQEILPFPSLQRTSLRRTVRDAEEACQKASKEMTKWEQKRMELTDF
jgi:hypothetical protein